MTLLSRLKTALARLGSAAPLVVVQPMLDTPPAPKPAAPELSCLVQGLIKSIQTEPDTWVRDPGCGWSIGIRQTSSDTVLSHYASILLGRGEVPLYRLSVSGHSVKLTKDEEATLKPIIEARLRVISNVEKAHSDRLAQESTARAVARAQPHLDRFSALGCPTPVVPSPETTPAAVHSPSRTSSAARRQAKARSRRSR